VSSRTDPWHCASCGAPADLAPRSAEVALVRLALDGEDGFRFGTDGIEAAIEPLLEPCGCGGRLIPGDGDGAPVRAAFDRGALRPVAEQGMAVLEVSTDGRLSGLRQAWRPRLLPVLGREGELEREEVLRARLEDKLERLQYELQHAAAVGDQDAAEAAHARYIELGTTYVRRFVARDERAEAAS
jgi:hypothetical protein